MRRHIGRTPEITVEAWTQLFAALEWVHLAVLFGSRAAGHVHPRSDYDIAVACEPDHPLPWGAEAEVEYEIRERLNLEFPDVNIIDLERAPSALRSSIRAHHVILKGSADAIRQILAGDAGSGG